ncbi:MAG: ABC transporter permease [Chloroflexi bacterium]|nr:ABC transporter permease [Chloroflexota bacterium]
MAQYLVRRFLLAIPTLVVIMVLVFSILRFLPGDIVKLMVAEQQYAVNEDELRKKLGLSEPWPVQFVKWTSEAVRGDFGKSLWTQQAISSELKNRFPVSAELGLYSVLIGVLIALPIGVLSAIRQDSILDYICRSISIGFISVPGFLLGTWLLVFPLIWWGWSPPLTYVKWSENPFDHLYYFFWPALLLGLGLSGFTMRLTRNQMLEVMRQDYIRTATSKGLNERNVIIRHALRNAMIPVVTVIGLQIAAVVSGTVIMETIFSIPGIGRFYLQAIQLRDYPSVQATALFIALTVLLTNIVIDVTYGIIDPRIRFS